MNDYLIIGNHILEIYFRGKFSNGDGLLKNIHNGTGRTVVYTRFEPNGARKCFPCFDEPQFKTKYNMKIQINDSSYNVLYNTDPKMISHINNKILYTFEETIPMSSYLSAFIICKYYFIEGITKDGIRMRVYIPNDKQNREDLGKFALDTGIKCMDLMTEYYQTPFPYNKIDFIPIDDTDVSGMENYGLIFYYIKVLLLDKLESTIDDKIKTANVIVHELAHQWFGNMLTLSKWDELWLKESFANFFEYYFVDKIFPKWNIKSIFVLKNLNTFELDSVASRQLNAKINDKNHVSQIYDKLTYFKGSMLLSELLNYFGDELFRTCIRKYIIKYKHNIIT